MVFEVQISTVSKHDVVTGKFIAEFAELPTPKQIELVCDLVMSDAKFAIATVHISGNPSILYGMIAESANYGEEE